MKVICDISITSARWRSRSWTPAALFAGGAQGVWYDPSQLGTVWQNVAATVGQPVARLDDLSGNGMHAVQPIAAAQPILAVDGDGCFYLAFDGIDDILETPGLPDHTFASLIVGYQTVIEEENAGTVFGIGRFATGRFYLQTSYGATRFNREPQDGTILSTRGIDADLRQVASARVGPSVDEFHAANNQNAVSWTGSGAQQMDLTGEKVHIGAKYLGNNHSAMRFFGGVYLAKTLSDTELSSLEGFLATKIGVTLG